MTRNQIKDMVLHVLASADYDLYKSFCPETAEEPEYAAEELETLIDVAEKYIINLDKKAKKAKKRRG